MGTQKIKLMLRDKDIRLAAKIFDVDEMTLKKLNDQQLLDAVHIRETLIRYNYDHLTDGLRYMADGTHVYTFKQVEKALSKEYGLSLYFIKKILGRDANKTRCFCNVCKKRIAKSLSQQTKGLCLDCYAQSLINNSD